MEYIINIIIGIGSGVISGVVASFIFWLIFTKISVPKIEFGPSICVTKKKDKFIYYYKYRNKGKRSVVDTEVYVNLFLYLPKDGYPNNIIVIKIPTHTTNIPFASKGVYKKLKLLIEDLDIKNSISIPNSIIQKFESEKTLETLLNIGEGTYLRIYMLGYDEKYGTRKFFKSKKYMKGDVEKGVFKNESFDITRDIQSSE